MQYHCLQQVCWQLGIYVKVPYSKLTVYCLSAMYSSSPAPLQLILISLWQREILYTEWIAFTTIYLSEAIIVSHMPISPDFSHNHFQYFWPCSCWSESFLLVRIKLHLDQQNNLKSLTQRLLSYLSYTFLLTQLMRCRSHIAHNVIQRYVLLCLWKQKVCCFNSNVVLLCRSCLNKLNFRIDYLHQI